MRPGLVVLAVLILGGIFWFSTIYLSPQDRARLQLAKSACQSTPGQVGQAIFPDVAQNCQTVSEYAFILALSPFVYLGGFVLLGAGAVLQKSKPQVVYLQSQAQNPTPPAQTYTAVQAPSETVNPQSIATTPIQPKDQPPDQSIQRTNKQQFGNYCRMCAFQMAPYMKFCPNCGTAKI